MKFSLLIRNGDLDSEEKRSQRMLSTLQSLFLSFQYAFLDRLKVSRSEAYRTQTLKIQFFCPFDLTMKLNIERTVSMSYRFNKL